MKKSEYKTVPVYARIAASDVLVVDRVADEERESRSGMVARIVREWAKKQERRK